MAKEDKIKKYFIALTFFANVALCFPQTYSDLPYSNPDMMTYLKQELTSLMRFEFENDIRIPFFSSFSVRFANWLYKPEYLFSLYPYAGLVYDEFNEKNNFEISSISGFQIKVNNMFSIPVFGMLQRTEYSTYLDEKEPRLIFNANASIYLASGLQINTDIVKGGIYLGVLVNSHEYLKNEKLSMLTTFTERDFDVTVKPKFAFAPLVNTSRWALVGKVLNNISGFIGTGDNIVYYQEDDKNALASAFFDALNLGLNLTVNKLHLSPLSLQANAVYSKSNYDSVAKDSMYGLNVQGQFNSFPLGFSLEGGYRRFFSIAKYFEPEYPGTGYFIGNIYIPLKFVTFVAMYQYDNIIKSSFAFAVSTNFLSAFYTFRPVRQFMDTKKFSDGIGLDFGIRYRHGGWRVHQNE